MRSVNPPVVGLVLALAVGGCQEPGDAPSQAPPGSPVAPRVQPSHPDAERTIPLPSPAPVAPHIQEEPTGPDPTVDLPDPS
jgi:hypothetical protein